MAPVNLAVVRSSIESSISLIDKARMQLMPANGFKSVEDAIEFLRLLKEKLDEQLRNIPKESNHCFSCGYPVAIGESYCGECMCEDDSSIY